ncbi:hypothetical protein HBI31_040590 [Parastagonospora nodorum]|nr:hypothetical protein HBI78_069860 [Parastagonospora nodorum]KAH5082416.1 hypothetical protein HBH95_053010 [Parastagonospora nodorum]KAH5312955.1 hypothetical protein HBI11_091160 [Parastagonospora nodorum]KAH5326758.1 hypothetical protein HBI50_086480 [Parastagonospora nodorum]KAH5508129.1 hypothetical protein HBI31_040590 [Parastagonospora nodorum]
MPLPMSLDTILEGPKQGNSLELEFIKQLKESLSFVAEGMQNECYNRSGALSNAIGKLEKERAKGHGHITVDQKAMLTSIIKTNILKCKSSLANNIKPNEKIAAKFVEAEGLNKLADIVDVLRNAPAADVLGDVMSVWEERQELLRREQLAIERNDEMEIDMAKICLDRVRRVQEQQIRILKATADAVGVDEKEIE